MGDESDDAGRRSAPFEPGMPLDFRPSDDQPAADPSPDASGVRFEPDHDPSSIGAPPPARPIFTPEAGALARPRAPMVESRDRGPAVSPSRWMIATVALVVVLVAGFLGLSVLFNAGGPSGTDVHVEVHGVTTVRDAPTTTL